MGVWGAIQGEEQGAKMRQTHKIAVISSYKVTTATQLQQMVYNLEIYFEQEK